MPAELNPLELGVAGGFVYLVLAKVLDFVRGVLAQRGNAIAELRTCITKELKEIEINVGSLRQDLGAMLLDMKVAQERQNTLWAQEWPAIQADRRRLGYIESDVAVIKNRLRLPSGNTPPDGVEILEDRRLPTK